MATPQPGIFVEGTAHHHFLEYALADDAAPDDLRHALAPLVAAGSGAAGSGAAGASRVVAFGSELWRRLAPDQAPDALRPFAPIEAAGGGADAPASQRDLFFWLHGVGRDDVLDGALAIHKALAPLARLELEETGFTYHDSRDLTGFIDGTANPKDAERFEVALVPDGETGAGGAFVLSQRWLHDLEAFNALSVADQEAVIGRTKPDSIELTGDSMPPDSHVSRTDATHEGVAMKIYRRSAPFGGVAEHGLYFLAFARDPLRFDVQLTRMFGTAGDGLHDRLIHYSRPVTGSYWFAPSEEDLRAAIGAG